jgi:hypothetical protein
MSLNFKKDRRELLLPLIWFIPLSVTYFWLFQTINLITLFYSFYFSMLGILSYLIALKFAKNIFIYLLNGPLIFYAISQSLIIWRAKISHLTLKQDGIFVFKNGELSVEGILAQINDHLPFVLIFSLFMFFILWRKDKINKT